MNSDFRKTGNSKNGAANSQSSSFQGAQEEKIKQIKDEIEEKFKPELTEKIEIGIEKEAKKKGINKILPVRENKEDRLDRIEKEARYEAEKNKYTNSDPLPKNLRRPEESRNLPIDSKRQKKIDKYTEETNQEARKEIEKVSKNIKDKRIKIVLKLAGDHFDKIAFAIARKMSKEANRGGIRAIIPIAITYFIAFGKDILDVVINLLTLTGVGAIVVVIVTAIIGAICAIILAMFWMSIGGDWKGGILKKKLLKKIFLKYGVRIVFVVVIGDSVAVFNILPLMLFFNVWAHLDFIKDVKKSKVEYRNFMDEYASEKRVRKTTFNNYLSKT
ncbi:hypothetical protein KAT63_04875 [Candidatus Parcubacteria bacterium]|nr:hypothetical protein [Candidatus Parcubacteria bacterium]